MQFVGDSINDYLSELCVLLSNKYNISKNEASNYIVISKFYLKIRSNFLQIKEKSPEFWAEKIYLMVQDGETFKKEV